MYKYKNLSNIYALAIDIDGTMTENGNGVIHLPALQYLRHLEKMGFRVIYVTGRSSIEAFVLAVFGGTTRIAVGENGGVITTGPNEHTLLASKEECQSGFMSLKLALGSSVKKKDVIYRMSEVVLTRSFDINLGQKILEKEKLNLYLNDSGYAYHINKKGVNKGAGLSKALEYLKINPENVAAIGDSETDIPIFDMCGYSIALHHSKKEVKEKANFVVSSGPGLGVIEAIDHLYMNSFLGNAPNVIK